MVFRFVQGFGTSGGIAVGQWARSERAWPLNDVLGGAVIGDIYKLTERGTAMGIFFAVNLILSSCTLT